MTPTSLDELIDILTRARPVFVRARSLPAALIRDGIASGLVSEWEDSPVGRAVLLSSLGCERMGLELSEGEIEDSRWVPIGSAVPASSSGPDGEVPDGASPEPEPLDALIAQEEATDIGEPAPKRSAREPGERSAPRPIVILGSSHPCWSPAVERGGASSCRVCRGRRLRPIEYCLACARSGTDHRLPHVPDRERPRAIPTHRRASAEPAWAGRPAERALPTAW
jgi:hypothetical protein